MFSWGGGGATEPEPEPEAITVPGGSAEPMFARMSGTTEGRDSFGSYDAAGFSALSGGGDSPLPKGDVDLDSTGFFGTPADSPRRGTAAEEDDESDEESADEEYLRYGTHW